jgi:hypothetical protein
MDQSAIRTVLKSKLAVYTAYYREARKTKDLKRIILFGPIISDLQNEIALLEE